MKLIILPILFLPAILLLISGQLMDWQGMWLYYFSAIALFVLVFNSKEV